MAMSEPYSAGRGLPAAAQMSLRRLREAGSISARAAMWTSGIAVQPRAYSAAFRPAPTIPNRNVKTLLQLRAPAHYEVKKTDPQCLQRIDFRLAGNCVRAHTRVQ